MLIIAATPIGNLKDASPRLVEALVTTKFIAAEDTRTLLNLVHSLGVRHEAKLFSLHEHNESTRLTQLVEIAKTEDVLLVSDAGMPTVSDPGFLLVRAAVEADVEVTVIPGPSAVLAALAVSGLPTDRFTFEGFLPRKSGERKKTFKALLAERRTMVFFESPHRIKEALEDAAEVFGVDRLATVSRELTKKFEHTERATLGELIVWAKTDPKGEMVLVVAGAVEETRALEDIVEEVLADNKNGLKQAVAICAEKYGVSKSGLYQAALEARALR